MGPSSKNRWLIIAYSPSRTGYRARSHPTRALSFTCMYPHTDRDTELDIVLVITLFGHLHLHARTHTQIQTQNFKLIKVNLLKTDDRDDKPRRELHIAHAMWLQKQAN